MSNIQPANSSTDDMTSLLGLFGLLSPELRNEIYQLTLVQDGPIRVIYSKGNSDSKVARLSPRTDHAQPDKVRYYRPKFNGSLLRTCRLINEEATPILYGQNTWIWVLAQKSVMPTFLNFERARRHTTGNKPAVSHLRTIMLGAWDMREGVQRGLGELKAQFSRMTSLRKIVISTGGLIGNQFLYGPTDLAKKLTPLMKEIMKKRGLDIDAAIGMIEFVPENYQFQTVEPITKVLLKTRERWNGTVTTQYGDRSNGTKAASARYAEEFKTALQLALTGKLKMKVPAGVPGPRWRGPPPERDLFV